MEVKHCVMDVREMLRLLTERRRKNVDEVRGKELTPVQEARFEVGTLLLMDLERDLRKMANAWEDGYPAYRVTEEDLEKD